MEEENYLNDIYARLLKEMKDKYDHSIEPIKAYNEKKIRNWTVIQVQQLSIQINNLKEEIQGFLVQESMARDSLEKSDIRKKAADKKKQLDRLEGNRDKRIAAINKEADEEIDRFNKQMEINPLLLINIVLKY